MQVPSGERQHEFVLQAMERGGREIEGVEVHSVRGDDVRRLGATDTDGYLRASSDLPVVLFFRHREYVTISLEVTDATPSELQVLLERGGFLRGHVQVVDGSPVPEDALVTAMPARDHSPRGAHGAPSPANPRIATGRPCGLGLFELAGLDPKERYVLRAAAPGWLASDRVLDARPGDEGTLLTLRPLYGFRLDVLAEGGEPPRTDLGATAIGGTTWQVLDDELEDVSDRYDDLQLAGLRDLDARRWHERPFVFAGRAVAPRAGPVVFHLRLAGYHPAMVRAWAQRVSGPEFERVELALTPSAGAWGMLRVRFDPDLGSARPSRMDMGSLELMDEGAVVIRLVLRPDDTYSLPAGTYRWRYVSKGNLHSIPAAEDERPALRIVAGEVEVIDVSLREAAAVEIELARNCGGLHTGHAILRFTRKDPTRRAARRHVTFASAPYSILGVEPGTYELAAITGTVFQSPGFEEYFGTAELLPGERATVVLAER